MAMIVWLPTTRVDVVNVATPLPFNEQLPKSVLPMASRKSTAPVGVPEPDAALTMAVKVTDCPKTEETANDVRTVVVTGAAIAHPQAAAAGCERRVAFVGNSDVL